MKTSNDSINIKVEEVIFLILTYTKSLYIIQKGGIGIYNQHTPLIMLIILIIVELKL